MKKFIEHRYTRNYTVGKNTITIRVASRSILKYVWHRLRASYARRHGNSYEHNDVDHLMNR